MRNVTLKNCPLCGQKAVIATWRARKGYEGNIECTNCLLTLLSITYDDEDTLVDTLEKRWNSRAEENSEPEADIEVPTSEAMKGPNADVTNLTREEALYFIKHHCEECPIPECAGYQSAICEEKIQYLLKKYGKFQGG